MPPTTTVIDLEEDSPIRGAAGSARADATSSAHSSIANGSGVLREPQSARNVPPQTAKMPSLRREGSEDSTAAGSEVQEGAFSDGEDVDDKPEPSASATGVEGNGFEFSGMVGADASQPNCPLCNQPLEVSEFPGSIDCVSP